MSISNLSNKSLKIGTIFTPIYWGKFFIKEFGIFEKWIRGATVFDPTMGTGNLLFALVEYGIEKGYSIEELPINRLFGVELNTEYYLEFMKVAKKKYSIIFPKNNFINDDIFLISDDLKFDIIISNPPWQNFADLPENYKKTAKKLFFEYDLIGNPQDLLLGGSRIDIAALVIKKTLEKNLKNNGEAFFFTPLSLLLNDGANKYFRTYKIHNTDYHINKIFDFNSLDIFNGVATRYGLIHVLRDQKQEFPIKYSQYVDNRWKNMFAQPIFSINDPLSISRKKTNALFDTKMIRIERYSQPRQGINTGGANDIFFFDSYLEVDNALCRVKNKKMEVILPKKYIFPLITSKNFKEENPIPQKWVLLLHDKNGKPLDKNILHDDPFLWEYLISNQDILKNRKGVLINTWIKKDKWWALLGVGEYNFFSHKIVWEAYGKNTFTPKIFSEAWQANQSLQAFIPTKSISESLDILTKLNNGNIQNYLMSLQMEGTMNWAQPGKIKKLLAYKRETLSLFPS